MKIRLLSRKALAITAAVALVPIAAIGFSAGAANASSALCGSGYSYLKSTPMMYSGRHHGTLYVYHKSSTNCAVLYRNGGYGWASITLKRGTTTVGRDQGYYNDHAGPIKYDAYKCTDVYGVVSYGGHNYKGNLDTGPCKG